MRRICNLLIIVLMVSLATVVTGCAAKFEVSSLEVSPEVCLPGDTVMVSATLANAGNAKGEYAAELLVNGAMEDRQTLTLEPGLSQSVSFSLMKVESGRYVVQLGELTASFTVLGLSNLKVSPSEVEADQPVTVSADVRNLAETPVTYYCRLLCQGKEIKAEDITVAGGSTEKVTFTLSQATPGMYKVQLGNLSDSFKVLKPAGFEVVSLDILPNPVKVGEETTITITIENVGETDDTYTATVILDGLVEQTMDVTLAGGATKPVSFSLSKDSPGSYSVKIGGQEAVLRVWQPLPTGTHLVSKRQGRAKIEVTNRYSGLDAVVVLCRVEHPATPWVAFYVQAGDEYKTRGLGHGTYFMYVTLGEEWDDDSRKFLSGATYHRSEEVYKFLSTADKVTTWIFKFGPQPLGGLVSEDEFPELR